AILVNIAGQPRVSELCDDLRVQRGQRVLAKVANQHLRLLMRASLGRGALGGRDCLEVSRKRQRQRPAFRGRTPRVCAAHHFVFGASRPVFSVPLGAERLGCRRPAGFADQGFPSARVCLNNRSHERSKVWLAPHHCTETVPDYNSGKIPRFGAWAAPSSKSLNIGKISRWCPGPESNRHALRRGILSPLRLPISPPGHGGRATSTNGLAWRGTRDYMRSLDFALGASRPCAVTLPSASTN